LARNDYGPLREAHQKALNDRSEQPEQPAQETGTPDREPTRPEGHYQQSPGWTDQGGMAQQQASANAWVKASHERQAALDDRGQDKDEPRSQAEDSPSQPEREKKPELDERTQRFMEQMERSFSRDDQGDRSR
jgi:hypothetical protein